MSSMYHLTNALLQTRAEINNILNETARLNNILIEYRSNERRYQTMIDEIREREDRQQTPETQIVHERSTALSKKRLEESMDDKCGICMDIHKKLDTVRTCCGHDFGNACFDKWATTCKRNRTSRVTCPSCRAHVKQITSFRPYAARRSAAAAAVPSPPAARADDFDGTDDFITRIMENFIDDISDIDAELEGRILTQDFWDEPVGGWVPRNDRVF